MVNRQTLASKFAARFAGGPPRFIAEAPGRVNLIGEHVDYCGGLVLPMAIEWGVSIAAAPADDGTISLHSAPLHDDLDLPLHDLIEIREPIANEPPLNQTARPTDHRTSASSTRPPPRSWTRDALGVCALLLRAGVRLRACKLYLDADLPIGAGLSSSAALESALAIALLHLAGASIPPEKIARLCRAAEHEFAGVPCGIMDQFACLMSRAGHVMLIDCRDETIEHIAWPSPDTLVLVIDVGASRALADGAYARLVDESRQALAHLSRIDPTLRSLRDATTRHLEQARDGLPDSIFRRARHVVSEIARTRRAAHALRRADWRDLGAAMNESHASLRDDCAVSTPALDRLADLLQTAPGVFGARLVGGGFGGCVAALVRRDALVDVEKRVLSGYDATFDANTRILAALPRDAARIIPWPAP